MADAQTLGKMSPQPLKVVERAKREPEGRFNSLAHLIDVPALERAYRRSRKDAAVGVDGVTKEEYGQDLEGNLQDLHERMKANRYRHQPIRRGCTNNCVSGHVEKMRKKTMTNKAMKVGKEQEALLDALIAGCEGPQDILGEHGLLKRVLMST